MDGNIGYEFISLVLIRSKRVDQDLVTPLSSRCTVGSMGAMGNIFPLWIHGAGEGGLHYAPA